MIRCYVTDSHSAGGVERLIEHIRRAVSDNVDWIQIREKRLQGRELAELTRSVLAIARTGGTKVLVNSRVDVALACGADGVHLPSDALSPVVIRAIFPDPGLIGVSTHTLEQAQRAETEGANYVVFGPVFESISKQGYGSKQGLSQLQWVSNHVSIPVLALGGVTEENSQSCVDSGASGIAAISLFQRSLK